MTDDTTFDPSRRGFLKSSAALGGSAAAMGLGEAAAQEAVPGDPTPEAVEITLRVNGAERHVRADIRASLLDVLRDRLKLTGTKKGCDAGHCGACTISVNGERRLACLTLAIRHQDDEIGTIEGLGNPDEMHSMQAAFVRHDAFQCGYCTPGQIMSAVACIETGNADTREEIKEFMSGNICRCAAFPNIVAAIEDVRDADLVRERDT
ncbi:(2Fe-2S)-binding protein [Aestuariibius insulae]|uniref:(2Fe-2S)-binding protein n=1 Tax=Aestuariibius insulae TaxID=2058287 RepID=UPI00345E7A5A